jgi:hypothetical protein
MTDEAIEIDTAEETGPTDVQISVVSHNTMRAVQLMNILIPEAQAVLDKLTMEYKTIIENALPDAFDAMHTSGFQYRDGNIAYDLKLEEAIQASITEANKPQAFEWLNKHGYGDLIKRQIVIEFTRDQQALYKKFIRDLAKRKTPLNQVIKETVHAGTLKAFVRELREEAAENQQDPEQVLPKDIFSIFKQRFVKFIEPKKKKIV